MFYLHSIGVPKTRDLNPSNILLEDSLFPKICGFGLSKNVSEKDYSEELKEIIEMNHVYDKKSRVFGTPGFIAPEIYINNDYSILLLHVTQSGIEIDVRLL
ncbi:hypothetical protein M9Y10_015307 [Tritrichomonas musculus]|uniref:Protein kinase domain-containing protein n=1 Tax=Tritrichomonas musculus TaxID=1915356 RepID=A0ABR2L2S4_9EUKA